MAMFQRSDIGVREDSIPVSIPDNDVAKCMYYLNCVCSVINYNDTNIRRYTNYREYWRLSADEAEIVYKLCLTLSPDEFKDKVFFESDAMCGASGNKFFEISQVRNRLSVVGSILIAGRSRQVTNIMTYKMSWMQTNYFGPMNRLADQFNPERRLIRALQENDCTIS